MNLHLKQHQILYHFGHFLNLRNSKTDRFRVNSIGSYLINGINVIDFKDQSKIKDF